MKDHETNQADRRYWLIDAQCIFQPALERGLKIDYRRMREWLERNGPIVQGYYVDGVPDQVSEPQRRFHRWLKMGAPVGPQLQTRLHPLKKESVTCPQCSHEFERLRQKGVDVDVVTLALTLIDRYDTLLLSVGDGDYQDTLEFIRNTRNKRIEVVAFRGTVSADLQAVADRIHWLDDVVEHVTRLPEAA
jgi:uncharacterized LabA/DUF88 family protein